jgi:hypothetical protein
VHSLLIPSAGHAAVPLFIYLTQNGRKAAPSVAASPRCKFIAFIGCANGIAADLIDYSVSLLTGTNDAHK